MILNNMLTSGSKRPQIRVAFLSDLNCLNALNDWNNSPGELMDPTLRLARGHRRSK
jgi:hypothetical protein